jgi:hypothetical protein
MTTEKFYFSYSSLVKLINDPKLFYKEYILGEKETKDEKYLKEGQLFHLFVLEPERFDEKFILLPTSIPTGYSLETLNKLITVVLSDVAFDDDGNPLETYTIPDLNFLHEYILDIMQRNNFYQSLKTDQQRLDKIINPEGQLYWHVLQQQFQNKRTIVDVAMVSKAKEKADLMLKNEECQQLINSYNSKEDVRKELELQYDVPNYSFGLKGVIDCVKIDYTNETIYITDFKTTSKSLKDWRNSFETSEYMYWLQVIIYKELILSLVPNGSKTAWKLKVNFPVIDKNNNVYVFGVSVNSLYEWQIKTKEMLEIAKWHYENEKYELPYEYYVGKIEL